MCIDTTEEWEASGTTKTDKTRLGSSYTLEYRVCVCVFFGVVNETTKTTLGENVNGSYLAVLLM